MKRLFIRGYRCSVPFRLLAGLVLASFLASCGGDGDDGNEARQQAAYDKLSRQNQQGRIPTQVLDSLRAMKARFNITRDDYWEEKGGVLANDFFELWYPPGGVTVTHGMYAFGELVAANKKFKRLFGGDPGDHLKVVCEATMLSFKKSTGLDWWVYAEIDGDEIRFQPVDVLYQRSLGDIAVPRGYYEWGILKLSGARAPQWLTRGLASLLADEEWFLENQLTEFPDEEVKMDPKKVDAGLGETGDRKTYRFALYNAFRMTRRINAKYGQDKVIEAIRLMGEGDSAGKAFEKTFGQSYDEVLAYAGAFQVNR